ncbi:cytoplasmic dynein 1 light intermediate chain 2 isoform X2 [Atheta coriaria]|uniref:cytoplasmic dynein 1 light intermediate chain 2 isoform X2 n=1 Tax=Dalotia coriaria TaxID=877792 RepID=UPI0031F387D1
MSPTSEVMSPEGKLDENAEKENLWSSILNDVQNHGNQKLPSCKQVLVLGDNESGKTTLVAKLQGVEDPKKGSGLEYAYIDVRDDYRDDHTRLSVWVLDGDQGHADLLPFALSAESFEHTLVILTVTMTAPWAILEQLQHWASVLADHLDKLKLDIDLRQARRQHIVKMWHDYMEPGDELDPSSPMKRSSRNLGDGDEDNEESIPLPEATLTNNLGLDIVVVVTKTDYMQVLEKVEDYRDEQLDFMQQWIRRFCLQYGAALFYTSAKEDKNCDLLYKYLTHRIYGFPFRTPALVVEKDAVFIPAGWDNMKKISILYESMTSCKPDDYYGDFIMQQVTRKTISREPEITVEEEQSFLVKQQQLLLSAGAAPPPMIRVSDSPLRAGAASKLDCSKTVNTPGGEGVLANFFNSLLNKKPASPGTPGAVGSPKMAAAATGATPDTEKEKEAMRSGAAAALDRLSSRAVKPSGVDFDASDC